MQVVDWKVAQCKSKNEAEMQECRKGSRDAGMQENTDQKNSENGHFSRSL